MSKKKYLIIGIVFMFLLAACAPASQPALEEQLQSNRSELGFSVSLSSQKENEKTGTDKYCTGFFILFII